MDICIPANNEKELIKRAQELGIKQLVFLYDTKSAKELQAKKAKYPDVKVGIYLKPKKPQIKISNQLFLEADLIAVSSQNEAVIRSAVSNPKIDLVFGIPSSSGKDHLHYRRSNFNEILANLAKQYKVRYAIDFSQLLENQGIARAKLWGREAQNVKLSRRKIPIIIASFAKNKWQLRNPNDLAAIAQLLGLTSSQAKNSVSNNIFAILKEKEKRRSKTFVAPGIKLIK